MARLKRPMLLLPLLLMAVAFGPGSGMSVAAPPAAPNPSQVYAKTFEDHFESSTLNSDYWTFGLRDPGTGHVIPGAQGDHLLNSSYDGYATQEDTYIQDGSLVLRNQKRNYAGTSPARNFNYTTGWVMSMHKVFFNKGYIEFRAKFPRGDKVWPALWLIPESRAWPPEWDMWEYFGYRSDVGYDVMGTHLATGPNYQNVNWYTNWLTNYNVNYGNDQWHVYGFEWTATRARWWIDGQLVHTRNAAGVSGYPNEDFYIVMNNGTKTDSPDTNTTWPNYLTIDYVELYELATLPVTSHVLSPSEPDGNDGWYREGPVMTLSAQTEAERIDWRYGESGPFGEYTGPVELDDEGEDTEIQYQGVGQYGVREEVTNRFTYSLDATAPVTALTVEATGAQPNNAGNYPATGAPYLVTLSANDLLSGTDSTLYCVAAGCTPNTPYVEPFDLQMPGLHVVRFQSTDVAGNVEPVRQAEIEIVKTDTTTALKVKPGKVKAGKKVTLTATVKATSAVRPGGTVVFTVKGKKFRKQVNAQGVATVKVKLPGKHKGSARVRAAYQGSRFFNTSQSKTVKVKRA